MTTNIPPRISVLRICIGIHCLLDYQLDSIDDSYHDESLILIHPPRVNIGACTNPTTILERIPKDECGFNRAAAFTSHQCRNTQFDSESDIYAIIRTSALNPHHVMDPLHCTASSFKPVSITYEGHNGQPAYYVTNIEVDKCSCR